MLSRYYILLSRYNIFTIKQNLNLKVQFLRINKKSHENFRFQIVNTPLDITLVRRTDMSNQYENEKNQLT